MDLSGFLIQLLNGLAEASSLFLVAAGLSLIFGVTRIVNFAHGSFYMLGIYLAYSLVERLGGLLGGPVGYWFSLMLAALLVGAIGALVEVVLLRRIYKAPELFQLLATFALVLVVNDAVLWLWGPEELLGRRAPGLAGSIELMGRQYPTYNLLLIAIGPAVLGLLWLLLTRTRWGTLVRAATQDREMLGALGVNQAWLFTGVFALGAMLAGLGGAVQLPREPASLALDLRAIGEAFVIVVVGGMGSIPGAYVAALLIAEIKALCVGLGTVHWFGVEVSFSKLTLVVEFLVMALVLVFRPWGLMGRPQTVSRNSAPVEAPLRPGTPLFKAAVLIVLAAMAALPLLSAWLPYATVLAQDVLVAVLFAVSLHFIMGPGGMHSFGHAAYYGLGAYGAAVLLKAFSMPMPLAMAAAPLVAGAGALVFGWFCVRLSGVYLAMLTLAFSQIVWSIVFQWDDVTGGSNGMIGVWPAPWLGGTAYYYLTLALVALSLFALRRMLFAPFGLALRAGRDSALRADAVGIDVKRVQWMAFVIAGVFGGLAGSLFVFSKGSISPEAMAVGKSVDGLVMVLLGGIQTLLGPIVGAAAFNVLQDTIMRATDYWRALFGGVILLLVLAFPQGIAGFAQQVAHGWAARRRARVPATAGEAGP
ncbi:ABC transporter permease [Paracidovorax valerianellae]|uniref:Amino acid/amide ABC transporter membrane protein 1, HAAT family (TC 3.A.1.4.-)/amino acid/amide ABC transporter membrane protein 2, HAAT family (TC 3.A.1.4.-) n=1 Tax=Paracidovorax valerianellae TaxID=187868 RepID=A0A1G6SGW5_9BURK|nr:ABC transporter permease [Paracidovorax valerianellae]MDA8444284.1 ABC transporter permease [Paracidovorax valerianellae]SDD15894.1 amino acid/amide ABC transporter membrane protein 1, HAAT family (TC 3.A.1.4.-)/amino acid/amide ABC transporter membrane protein 2, HAAT family (TC 3.A.1.4.-) [Paracidovorax valerianellae]